MFRLQQFAFKFLLLTISSGLIGSPLPAAGQTPGGPAPKIVGLRPQKMQLPHPMPQAPTANSTARISAFSSPNLVDASSVFAQAPTYTSGGGFIYAQTIADINKDGIPDVLVAECGPSCSGLVGVLLGNGDGTYQTAQTYGSGGYSPTGLVVADVNGDGIPDVVVSNTCLDESSGSCTGNGTVGVLLGSGDGTFQPAQSFDTGALYASSVVVADLNGDGKPDLLVAKECTTPNDCSGLVAVLLGNGDGTFQAARNYSAGFASVSISVADLNHDGKPDVVVANRQTSLSNPQGTVSVLLGNGDGSFQAPQTFSSGGIFANTVLVVDLNKDGNPDVIVLNECASVDGCDVRDGAIGILLGNGDGTFQAPQLFDSGGTEPLAIAAADLNGDSKLDLVIANGAQAGNTNQYVDGSVAVLLGNGDGTFVLAHTYNSMGWTPHAVGVANLNTDGIPDIVVANETLSSVDSSSGSVAVMLGNGDGSFRAAPVYDAGGVGFTAAVSIADLNADGKADLVITSDSCADGSCNGVVGVKLGNGDGTFQAAQAYNTGGNFPLALAIADVNRDGIPDLLVANQCIDYDTCETSASANGSVAVFLGRGNGTFGPAQIFDSGGVSADSLATADVNGDGKLDILVANRCSIANDCTYGSVSVLLGNGDGTFQTATTFASGANRPIALVAADVNGDGVPDVLMAHICMTPACAENGQVAVLLGNGDGSFAAPVLYDVGVIGAYYLALADMNGDGKPDVVVGVVGFVGVLLGNGDGTFQAPNLSPEPTGYPGQIVVGDFNGDGKLDVASEAGSLFLGNGDGTFTVATGLLPPGPGIAAGDLNGDGKPDLAIGGVTVLLNASSQSKLTPTITWSAPAPISYGTPLSSAQLDATADVPGSFVYSPGPGAVLSAGSQALNATFTPTDVADYTTAMVRVPLVVNQASSTVVLTSSLNPSIVGQSVTFTASVTGQSPSGTVTFTDGANSIGTIALTGGSASVATSALTLGPHTIVASYSGDSNNLGSTSPLAQAVNNLSSSSTALVSSLNPSTVGQSVTFTATVTGQSPTGTVRFTDGGSPIGTPVSLSGGVASLSTSALIGGSNSIVATYSGDSNNLGSTSSPLTQMVSRATSIVIVISSPNPPAVAQPVTFTVEVSGVAPTGVVTFMDGSAILGSSNLVDTLGVDSATFQVSSLSAGPHSITANYGGDANNLPGVSPPLTFVLPHATVPYSVIDLGTLGGSSFGMGINNNGQVTGESELSDQIYHAFLISPPYTQMIDLDTLGTGDSLGQSINNLGQVTGSYTPKTNVGRAFLTSAPYTSMIDLGDLGGGNSSGWGINDSGLITGYADTATKNVRHAFLWNGTMQDLGTLGNNPFSSSGFAINNAGQITGSSVSADLNSQDVFLYTPGGTMTDLGSDGNGRSINASGQIAGDFYPGGGERAFLFDGTMHNLGILGGDASGSSVAYGINASGQVTGASTITGYAVHAFLYTALDGMVDLNSLLPIGSNWTLYTGYSINDAGQITGYGFLNNDPTVSRAFVLTPSPPPLGAFISGTTVAKPPSGTAAAIFTVIFNNSSGQPFAVNFNSADGTALAGADYIANSGTLTFAPGITTQTVAVQVIGGVPGSSNLSFSLQLKTASGGNPLGSATGNIVMPPPQIAYTLSASPQSVPLAASANVSSTITLQSLNGIGGNAHLTAAWSGTAPTGVTFGLSAADVSIPAQTSASVTTTLTFTASASPSAGIFTLRVTSISAGGVTRFVDVTVTIASSTPPPTCCTTTGPFVNPAQGVSINISQDGTSLGGKYQVMVAGGAPVGLSNISVKRVADGQIILTTQTSYWGFSPDDDRFVTHSLLGAIENIALYDLTRALPLLPTWKGGDTTHSSRIQFSPSGRYLFYTDVVPGAQTYLRLVDAHTGTLEFMDTIQPFAGAPGQDSFGTLGWGFGPNDTRFVYAWPSTQTDVEWNLINLEKGPGNSARVKEISLIGDTADYWQFSLCGEVVGLVRQPGQQFVNVEIYNTVDGTSAGLGAQITPAQSVQLRTTTASQVATAGGIDYPLGENNPPCTTSSTPPPQPPACCTSSGPFVDPAPGVNISTKVNGVIGVSPGGKYQVVTSGTVGGLASITVTRLPGNTFILNAQATSWGFSPDDDRFVTDSAQGSIANVALYNLAGATPSVPTWTNGDTTLSTRIQFSPTGHYLFYSDVVGGPQTNLTLVDAQTGTVEFTDSIKPFQGAPVGDSFGTVGWGFGPKDSRFVYGWVSTQTSVDWNLINLEKGPGNSARVKEISLLGETADYWQFSSCGEVIGLVHQPGQTFVNVEVFNTKDGTSAGNGAQITPVQSIQLNTKTSYVATAGGQDYPLGAIVPGCTLTVGAHSPVDILLVDTQGRRCGFDGTTGTVINEIPGASYSGPGTEPETITVPYFMGQYVIDAYGLATLTAPASYRLSIATADDAANLVDEHDTAGIASNGSSQQFDFTLDNQASVTSLSPVDNTPPVITANVSGTSGNNGWYTSDVVVNWTVADAESPVDSSTGCSTQSVTSDTAAITFTCTATSAGGTASNSITIKRDTTPPTLLLPGTIIAEATSPAGAVVAYTATANDLLSGAVGAQCSPTSGSAFPLGTTTVSCSAADAAGNIARGSFPITVRDTTPPSISITPNNVTVMVTSVPVTRAALNLPVPVVSDLVDPHPTVTDNGPASFSTGTYTIIFTATDASGNRSTTTLTVHVEMSLTVLNAALVVTELRKASSDSLAAELTVQLASGSAAVNRTAGAFHFQVTGGTVNLSVDLALSQFANVGGTLVFSGPVNGSPTDIAVTPLGHGKYLVVLAIGKTNLSGFANPATLTLGLGSNVGGATTDAIIIKK